jgi:arylsulfatase
MLADDQGFSDWSCFGSEIPTPNIDALGAGGLKFTRFYNCAMCSPTRAALLSGAYQYQAGLGWLEQLSLPDSAGTFGHLSDRVATFAELLKGSGYFTAMAGKWHLGITRGVGPWQRGFDRSIASPQGRMYFPDQKTGNDINEQIYIDGKEYPISAPEVGKGEWYSADLFVDYAIRYIKEAKQQGKPFAVYVPFVNAHFPLMAPPEAVARFKGKYMEGWDVLRERRFARQKELGLFGPHEILPPREPNTYNWTKLTLEQQATYDNMMAVYAADVASMDKAIGTIVAALKSMGDLDNTLICLMSDNGGNAESGPDGRHDGEVLGSAQSFVMTGMNWASLQNTPFRYFKTMTYEGGISTPLIVHWPAGIDPSLNGHYVGETGHVVDVMPTLLEVSGTHYPKTYNGHQLVELQGRSFAPAFRGRALARSVPLYFELQGNRAIRADRWKLVENWHRGWNLYDMSADRSETNDVISQHPDIAFQMAAQWNTWAATHDMDPWTFKTDQMIDRQGHRQNWSQSGTPKLPDAMDSKDVW